MSERFELFNNPEVNEILSKLALTVHGSRFHTITMAEWQDFLKYLQENIMSEERILKEYNSGKRTGEEQERNRIVKRIRDKAAELFVMNKDEDARRLRELANEIAKPL